MIELEVHLETEPEFCFDAESLREVEGCFGRDTFLAPNDFAYQLFGATHLFGKRSLRKPPRVVLLSKDVPRNCPDDRGSYEFSGSHSVVVFDVDDDEQVAEFVLFELQNQAKLVIEADRPLVLTVSLQLLVVKALEIAELTLVGDRADDRPGGRRRGSAGLALRRAALEVVIGHHFGDAHRELLAGRDVQKLVRPVRIGVRPEQAGDEKLRARELLA